jgi:hypothetical protein
MRLRSLLNSDIARKEGNFIANGTRATTALRTLQGGQLGVSVQNWLVKRGKQGAKRGDGEELAG